MKNTYRVINEKGDIAIHLGYRYSEVFLQDYPVEALVSGRVFELVRSFEGSWRVHESRSGKLYARISIKVNGKRKWLSLHRVVTNAPRDKVVHHKNIVDCLDCRDENLELVTNSENLQRRREAPANSRTGVTYVYPSKDGYVVYGVHGKPRKRKYLGWFEKLPDAIRVRRKYEAEHEDDSRFREVLMAPVLRVMAALKECSLARATEFLTPDATICISDDNGEIGLFREDVFKSVGNRLNEQLAVWKSASDVQVAIADDLDTATATADIVTAGMAKVKARFNLVFDSHKTRWFVDCIHIIQK